MKKILFKKSNDFKKGIKSLSIRSKFEDNESKTNVRKSFVYRVSRSESMSSDVPTPEIHIRKSLDTRKRIETFDFQVKGMFFVTHQRFIYKVNFHHSLNIKINWKTKTFSPKKSEALT